MILPCLPSRPCFPPPPVLRQVTRYSQLPGSDSVSLPLRLPYIPPRTLPRPHRFELSPPDPCKARLRCTLSQFFWLTSCMLIHLPSSVLLQHLLLRDIHFTFSQDFMKIFKPIGKLKELYNEHSYNLFLPRFYNYHFVTFALSPVYLSIHSSIHLTFLMHFKVSCGYQYTPPLNTSACTSLTGV